MEQKEQIWEYPCHFLFNKKLITNFTLTDHWQENHPEISKEFIAKLFLELEKEERIEPTKYRGKRMVYKWEKFYQGQRYRFIFWFKDNTTNHLWIRNCFRID